MKNFGIGSQKISPESSTAPSNRGLFSIGIGSSRIGSENSPAPQNKGFFSRISSDTKLWFQKRAMKEAIETENLEKFTALIADGFDPNTEIGEKPLLLNVIDKDRTIGFAVKASKILIERGAIDNFRDEDLGEVLRHAVRNLDFELVKVIFEKVASAEEIEAMAKGVLSSSVFDISAKLTEGSKFRDPEVVTKIKDFFVEILKVVDLDTAKRIILSKPEEFWSVSNIAGELRNLEAVCWLRKNGAYFADHYFEQFLINAVDQRDIETINALAESGYSFDTRFKDMPALMYAIENFSEEDDPQEISEIKTFLTKAAEIMFKAGARLNVYKKKKYYGQSDSIMSSALKHEHLIEVAKIITAHDGGKKELDRSMHEAALSLNATILKRALALGANITGGAVLHPLDYLSRNEGPPKLKREIADILIRSGSDLGFQNNHGQRVLEEVSDPDVLNSIALFTTLASCSNQKSPNNWPLLQAHLQGSEPSRDKLTPLNKHLLNIYLPEGELKNMIAPQIAQLQPEDLNQLDQTSENLLALCLPDGELKQAVMDKIGQPSERLEKLLEIKKGIKALLDKKNDPNSELSANKEIIDLVLNPEKLKEIVNLNTYVTGLDKTLGHDSILMKKFEKRVGENPPENTDPTATVFPDAVSYLITDFVANPLVARAVREASKSQEK